MPGCLLQVPIAWQWSIPPPDFYSHHFADYNCLRGKAGGIRRKAMLTKLQVKNFKCFEDTGELELRPLTVFVGPNSSGKSSIVQFLLALRQTVESMDIRTAFAPNDGWVRLGSYPDFIFRHDWQRELEAMLEFTEHLPAPVRSSRQPNKLRLRVRWRYNRKTTQIRLEESELVFNDGEFSQSLMRRAGRYEATLKIASEDGKEWRHEVLPVHFYDFAARIKKGEKPSDFRQKVPRHPRVFAVRQSFYLVFYLGPLREFPQRSYVISGQAPSDVGVRGERSAEALWFASRTKKQRQQMLENINRWVKEFGIAKEVKLQRLGKSNQYQVLFVDAATDLPVNIADVGFGASQLLPIIVQGFYAPPESILLVEQPEIHLHPKAQATLGDLLMEVVKAGDRQVIVETHSEHLLARIQRRIAEQKFSHEQVAIYYFEPTPGGTKIHRLELDEYGQLVEPIPEGFFEEGLEEALAHMKAVGERKAEEVSVASEGMDN
jgi:predicted ATPase